MYVAVGRGQNLVFMRSSMSSPMSTFSINEKLDDLSKEVVEVSKATSLPLARN